MKEFSQAVDIGAEHPRALRQKAARATTALMLRQAVVYGANLVGGVVLARLLPPAEFGLYGLAVFAIAFLGIFGGTGLAARLIVVQDEPAEADKQAVFAAQQLLVLAIFVLLWLAAPLLAALYRLPATGVWFFRLLGGALILTSFMVLPQVQMQRALAFDRLALVEGSQALAFNFSAILLAVVGCGVLSFAIALLIRAAVGAVLAQRCSPWPMAMHWSGLRLRRHLHYGLALQISQGAMLLKDSIAPLFVGIVLGTRALGYLTWATSLAAYAVWLLMPLQRLYLPLFARMAHEPRQLRLATQLALWMANAVAAPLTAITLALARPITTLVFGAQWLAALPLFYVLCWGNILIPSSTPLVGLLNALDRPRQTLWMHLLWLAATWGLGVPCGLRWGVMGFAVAMLGVQLTNLVLFGQAWRAAKIATLAQLWPSWPLAAALAVLLMAWQRVFAVRTLAELVATALLGLAAYALALWCGFARTRQAWALLQGADA